MSSLYKYLCSRHLDSFVDRGEVRFRSLSYFRDYEESKSRGDRTEGTRIFRPPPGLDVTKVRTGEKLRIFGTFESSANAQDILVFCLSTCFSADLASEFEADACVEIVKPFRFIGGIRAALKRRPSIRDKRLVYGHVKYYEPESPPDAAWAVREQIAMNKPKTYERQDEYRISFALNDAFDLKNIRTQIVTGERDDARPTINHAEYILKIGNLERICAVHKF